MIVLDTHIGVWWVHGDAQLPAPFHRDPADQLIVATARVYNCPIVTVDRKIKAYPHVQNKP